MPKVSVIIPCYNQEDYLEDALNSLIGEFEDFEVIVVNDGSTNFGAVEKIQSVIENFSQLQIKFINQENQGVCITRNNAIKEAQGEYILPLDADDVITNSYLKEASDILDERSEIGIVYCRAEFFGAKHGEFKLKEPTISNMLTSNRIFNSAMYRKSDWEKAGGYKEIMQEGCEDWEFWISLMEKGLKTYKIDKIYFKYRKLDEARTFGAIKFSNYIKIRKNIIKLHKKLYRKYFCRVFFPLIFLAVKNAIYNCVLFTKTTLYKFKKFLRRIYFKTAINFLHLYPNIKRINKKRVQKEIEKFLNANLLPPLPLREGAGVSECANDTPAGEINIMKNIIISLTSIPERMHDIRFTLYSLLTQSVKPEKIILYLGKEKFPNGEKDVPENVLAFKNLGLEFRFVEDIRSFTKLVPALKEFPDKIIVTADDDIFYEKDWLKNLVETHNNFPEDIIVHKHLNVKLRPRPAGEDRGEGEINPKEDMNLPYKTWTTDIENRSSYTNFLLGVGGVLYPPNSLHKDVVEKKLFLRLCPHNDDVWFWAMAVMNGTKIRVAENNIPVQTLVNVERELNLNSEPTLYKGNRIGRTDREFMNVFNNYNLKNFNFLITS